MVRLSSAAMVLVAGAIVLVGASGVVFAVVISLALASTTGALLLERLR